LLPFPICPVVGAAQDPGERALLPLYQLRCGLVNDPALWCDMCGQQTDTVGPTCSQHQRHLVPLILQIVHHHTCGQVKDLTHQEKEQGAKMLQGRHTLSAQGWLWHRQCLQMHSQLSWAFAQVLACGWLLHGTYATEYEPPMALRASSYSDAALGCC
jgi:hypothetical protein